MNYSRRNGIEGGLETNVFFVHRGSLASEVRLSVDLDITLTVVANSCYRWLASRLKGFAHARPKQLSRKFIKASMRHGTIMLAMDTYGHLLPGQEGEVVSRSGTILNTSATILRSTKRSSRSAALCDALRITANTPTCSE